MSSSSLSASVTRILHLSNFPKELKTRDILGAFGEWESEGGGYKVKWLDDTNALIVFESPVIAKKAYLQTLLRPHANLGNAVSVRPYDGPDAQAVITAVHARGGGAGAASGVGGAGGRGHSRGASQSQVGTESFTAPPPSFYPLPQAPTHQARSGSHHFRTSSQHSRMGSFGTQPATGGAGVDHWGPAKGGKVRVESPPGGRIELGRA